MQQLDSNPLAILGMLSQRMLRRINVHKSRRGDMYTCPLAQATNLPLWRGVTVAIRLGIDSCDKNFQSTAKAALDFMEWWDNTSRKAPLMAARRTMVKDEIDRLLSENHA